jgi:hypothetical protein
MSVIVVFLFAVLATLSAAKPAWVSCVLWKPPRKAAVTSRTSRSRTICLVRNGGTRSLTSVIARESQVRLTAWTYPRGLVGVQNKDTA